MKANSFLGRFITRFLRVFFYLLYQPLAWSYDLVAWMVSLGRWNDWVLAVLSHLTGLRVLELGHGPGHLQVALHGKEISTFGIDASFQMARQAKRQILSSGYSAQITNGYAQTLPFPANCFNQIAATFPTTYIYAPETLLEIYRVLRPGGTLVVLPAAWITGNRLVDRGAATLFRVTGQTPDLASHPGWESQWLTPFEQLDFQTEFKMIHQKSWSLVILFAHKPDK